LEVGPITATEIGRAVNSKSFHAGAYARRLLGLDIYAPKDAIWNALHSPWPVIVPPVVVPAAVEPPWPPFDALAAATSIARSAAVVEEIDWTREPLTEREAAVRARMIEKHTGDLWSLAIESEIFGKGGLPASDIARAVTSIYDRSARNHADQKRKEVEEAIADLDQAA